MVTKEKYPEKYTSTVLSKFFQYLRKIGIDYCVIGRTDNLPNKLVGDVDIVINPDSLKIFSEYILEFCHLNTLQLAQIFQHEQTAYYFVLAWMDRNKKIEFLHLDISGDFFQNGRMFLTAKEVLSSRRPAIDGAGNKKGFFVLAPATEFIYYLFKKVDKQTLNDDHEKHLSAVWAKAPDECNKEIERFWPDDYLNLLRRAAREGDWEEARQNLPALEKSLLSKLPASSLGIKGKEFKRILKRILHPTGLHVAFLGPDGSGKSSVIDRVISDLAPAFRRTFSGHLRPRLGSEKGGYQPAIDPHGQDPRSLVVSIIKVFYYWFIYLIGWFVDVHPKIVRSTLVLFDRYYHDMIVDPKRYRYGGPIWLARWVGKLIPKPDLWILLDASPKVLQERKQEVPFSETTRQRKEYLKLVKGLKNGFVVDAAQDLNNVVADVNTVILDFISQRTVKHHVHCLITSVAKKVFPKGMKLYINGKVDLPGSLFWIIPGKEGEPRWILPDEHKYVWQFLKQWRPYGFLSRVKWKFLQAAYRGSCLAWVPGVISFRVTFPAKVTGST